MRARIEQGADAAGVSRDCGRLVEDLVLAGGLSRSPRKPPDLARGAREARGESVPASDATGKSVRASEATGGSSAAGFRYASVWSRPPWFWWPWACSHPGSRSPH